jgi:hypothetical protein
LAATGLAPVLPGIVDEVSGETSTLEAVNISSETVIAPIEEDL